MRGNIGNGVRDRTFLVWTSLVFSKEREMTF